MNSDVVAVSWLRIACRRHFVPGIVEPALELLKPVIDLVQDALDGGDRRIANRCGVKKKNESCQISRDQYWTFATPPRLAPSNQARL